MKITRNTLSPDEIQLVIEATPEEVNEGFDKGVAAFVEQFQLESLEGETPVDKIVGALGLDEAKDAIGTAVMSYLIPQALSQENIIPLSSSKVEEAGELAQNKPFTFTMNIVPKPSFPLSDYSTFTVEVPAPPAVTEEDIDEQIAMLAKEFATQTAQGDTENVVIPAVTDTWVQQNLAAMGINTVAELRAKFREQAEALLDHQYQEYVIGALMDVYFDRFEGEISDKMVDSMTTDMLENFKAELAQQGIEFDEYCKEQNTNEATIRATLAEQAKIQLIQGFILDAVYEHEKLQIELPDLMAMIHQIAPGAEEETFELMEKTGRTFLPKEGAQRNKALAWILENNTIVTPENKKA